MIKFFFRQIDELNSFPREKEEKNIQPYFVTRGVEVSRNFHLYMIIGVTRWLTDQVIWIYGSTLEVIAVISLSLPTIYNSKQFFFRMLITLIMYIAIRK